MIGSKLYPDLLRSFATLEEAVAYAQELEGYQELWRFINWADGEGLLFSQN